MSEIIKKTKSPYSPKTNNVFENGCNHSQKHHLPFSPRFCKFECNTSPNWLNRMVWLIRSCVTYKCC